MNQTIEARTFREPNKLLIYYQRFLALAAIAVFFTKLDVHLEQRNLIPFTPLYWIALFILASIPLLFFLPQKIKYFPKSIIIWSIFYVTITCFAIIVSPSTIPGIPVATTTQEFETRILATLSLFLMTAIFATGDSVVYLWVRRAILVATLVNVFNNIYEFFNPLSFGFLEGIEGRSAGFYVNANESAMALILGMIFSVSLVKKSYRIFFALIVLIGITFTFSRGGFLGWFIVVVMLARIRMISKKQATSWLVGVIVAISLLVTQVSNFSYLVRDFSDTFLNEDTLSRIEWITKPGNSPDPDGNSRYFIALNAWRKFAKSPIIGNGLSSARDRHSSLDPSNINRFGEQPHNIYLIHLVEHGFIGALIFPALLLATTINGLKNNRGEIKNIAAIFIVYYLLVGFVSHTLMYDNYSLLSLALMANLTTNCFDNEYSRERSQ